MNDSSMIISGFPGVGKTHAYSAFQRNPMLDGRHAFDSDSSMFSKHTGFPETYIDHVEEILRVGYAMIFVSSHKDVREELKRRNIPYISVYPEESLKDEYLERFKSRGNPDFFIELIDNNWDEWLKGLREEDWSGCFHKVLGSGEYLWDVLFDLTVDVNFIDGVWNEGQ